MAPKVIKGITIELGGEVTKLGQALAGVEKNARDIQAELRQVERLLKLDPKNTELLAQKQKLLTEAISASKERLETLKVAQEQATKAFAEGKIGEDQYRAIQREVIAAENEVKSLEKSLAQVNDKWATAAKGLSDFGSKTEAMGKKLLPVSAAAGAAVAGVTALAVRAGQAADDLNTLAAQTGMTTSQLQKFQYASGFVDVSMETFTGSLSRLTRSMRDARDGNDKLEQAFRKLGVRTTDNSGQLRDNEAVFYDLIDALGRISNESERDALSMQLFGKSAQELNPLILAGSGALKQYGDEAQKMGLVLDQETINKMNKFNDEMEKTKAQVGAAATQLGLSFGQALLPIIQSLGQWLQKVAEWFGKLDPAVARVIVVVLSLVAALAPMLIMVGKVAKGIGDIMDLGERIGPLSKLAQSAFSALTSPIGLTIAAIAAVIAIGVLLIKNWDSIKETAKKVFGAIGEFIAGVVDSIKKFFGGIIDKGKELIQSFKNIGKNLIEGLWEGIKGMGKWIGDKIKGFFTGLVDGIKGLLGIASPSKLFADTIGANMAAGVGEGFSKRMGAVTKAIGKELTSIAQTTTASVPDNWSPTVRRRFGGGDDAPALAMAGGYGTANIFMEMDGRVIARAVGQPLVERIRIKTGSRY